jgi:Flp pilus assembly protein TadD
MLFLLGLAIWSRPLPAFTAAALFAWHPVHVESVAWVAERKDVLCGFFWLMALCVYTKGSVLASAAESTDTAATGKTGSGGNRPRWIGLTLLCFVLGIMSKPMIVTLPFQLMLLDLWPLKRIDLADRGVGVKTLLRSAREKLPLFLITIGVCVWTYIAQHEAKAMAATAHMGLMERLANVLVSYGRYLGNIVWPRDLAVFYPLVPRWPVAVVLLAAVLFLGLSLLAVWQLRRRPHWFAGWFWFVGTLVPVIGIIHVGGQSMADRYAYLPAVGLYLALVQTVLPADRPPRWRVAALFAVILLLGWTAAGQIRTWKNGITVFTRAVEVTRDNWLAMNNLANNHAAAGDWAAAHPLFEEVARLNSGTAESHYNAGLARGEVGLLPGAEAGYRRALELDPGHFNTLKNLANLLTDRFGRHAEAVALYRRALEIRPGDREVRGYLADTLLQEQKPAEAEVEWRQILAVDPADQEGAMSLAALLVGSGRREAARDVLLRAAEAVNRQGGDSMRLRVIADQLAR